ncbi:MAG: hypothetical protein ACJAZS_000388 [Alteromonas naphthalenivorans]|jgi:hypothetical protein
MMKKLFVLILLGLSSLFIQASDSDNEFEMVITPDSIPDPDEFENINLNPASQREFLGLNNVLEKPKVFSHKIIRQHQLTMLKLAHNPDHSYLLDYVKNAFTAVDEDFWQMFTPDDSSSKHKQWKNLTFEKAQRISQPFYVALKENFNEDDKKRVRDLIKESMGKDTSRSAMLMPLVIKLNQENPDAIKNFASTLKKWTSDRVSFDLMHNYYSRQIDQFRGRLEKEHITPIVKPLFETDLELPTIEAALLQYKK